MACYSESEDPRASQEGFGWDTEQQDILYSKLPTRGDLILEIGGEKRPGAKRGEKGQPQQEAHTWRLGRCLHWLKYLLHNHGTLI